MPRSAFFMACGNLKRSEGKSVDGTIPAPALSTMSPKNLHLQLWDLFYCIYTNRRKLLAKDDFVRVLVSTGRKKRYETHCLRPKAEFESNSF